MNKIKASGGCHCGQVRFEIRVVETIRVQHCNCSMCSMLGFIHLIVPAADFHLLEGGESLVEYRFNSGTARHLFCARCGIKSFYVPRSNPDGFSVNLRCLQLPATVQVLEEEFDGLHWEQNATALAHLSEPGEMPGDEND